MDSINRINPCFAQVLGKKNSRKLSKEGMVLHKATRRGKWKVTEHHWKKRHVRFHSARNFMKKVLGLKAANPGKQLYEACISHMEQTGTLSVKEESQKDKKIRLKIASAFVLAGVCEIKKGKKEECLVSTQKAINARTLKKIERLSNVSPVRMAYMFLAKKKNIPGNYLHDILIPSLAEPLVKAGLSEEEAISLVKVQCKDCHLLKARDISLESLMEVKNRIRHLAMKQSDSLELKPSFIENCETTEGRPELPVPEVSKGYVCDEDDLWMIHHTVDNARTIRLARDFSMRVLRWAGRNKRVGAYLASGLALEMLLSGLATGGVGAAVTGLVSVGLTLGLFAWSNTVIKVRSALIKRKWENKSKDFDSFLDSCAYLVRNNGVTDIMNAYSNLENSVAGLKKAAPKASKSLKNQLAFQKQKRLIQIRSQQMEEVFGVSGSRDDLGEKGLYDQLIVESVQEISRLDQEFASLSGQLWQPFETMPSDQRWKLFNKVANSRKVKGKWYKRSTNYHKWIQESFNKQGADINIRVKEAFSRVPAPDTDEIHENSSSCFGKNMKKAAEEVGDSLFSFMIDIGKTPFQNIFDCVQKSSIPDVKVFLPRQLGPSAVVWAFYYFGAKVMEKLNKVTNQRKVNKIHGRTQKYRFDSDENTLSTADWRALRRETKESTQKFIVMLKDLRKEHEHIKSLLDKGSAQGDISEEKKQQLYATAILRREMLSQELNAMLAGAMGHMHEATIRAVWQQKQIFKSLEFM